MGYPRAMRCGLRVDLPADRAGPLASLITARGPGRVRVVRRGGEARLWASFPAVPEAAFIDAAVSWLSALGVADAPLWTRQGSCPWREGWRAFFTGARVTDRIRVRAPWEAPAPGAGPCLVLDPGAFGTGGHPTTRGILEALDRALADRPGARVLDVGCGSGILAIAAALLGSDAVAVDTDPAAVANARANAALNGVADRVRVLPGSADGARGSFDVVVANVVASALVALAPVLDARCTGTLLLSGLLVPEFERVVAAFPGRAVVERRDREGWVVLTLA